RHGYLRYGVTPAGPMDWLSHAMANTILGNPPNVAAIEVGPAGLSFTTTAPLRVAIAAPGFRVLRAGNPIPSRAALTITPGLRIDILPGPEGTWAYIALTGGIAADAIMGSLATHQRSGLGPFGGGPLQTDDLLHATAPAPSDTPDQCIILPATRETLPIRYIPGPQDDLFPPATHTALQSHPFTVSPKSDRMAYRLIGPPLPASNGHDIVSDGIPLGAIQVPGDGQPFVLMADRQPTGGYPKIGCIIRADLPRMAQLRPGQPFQFAPVTVDQAVTALAEATASITTLHNKLRTMRYLT
ncbi:MAG: biotin-dependent carboxyltransferase family protein, partial [Paracoccaceae bacterium]